MTFYVYDPMGYRMPYDAMAAWREVRKTEAPQSVKRSRKRSQEKDAFEESSFQEAERRVDYSETGRRYRGSHVLVASQIMSRNLDALHPEDSILKAWELFTKKRYRHIPVVNDEQAVVGILSDRTMLSLILLEDQKVSLKEVSTVKEVMVSPVLTAHLQTDVRDIARIFIEENIGAMPIVDQDRLVGMLTRTDLLRTQIKIPFLDLRG